MTDSRLATRVARLAFLLYALALVTATHWPRLRIEGPVPRTDLYIHIGAYFGWTILLIAAQLTGPWRSRRAVLTAGAIALVYASIDEGTQAIPALGRTFGFDDLAADLSGVLLAVAAALIAARLTRRPSPGPARPHQPE